jgi:hypothetical protein
VKQPYKPKVEYKYTLKDIAELAGVTRNALGVAKVRGKIDPGDFKSVVSFLTRRITDKHLAGDNGKRRYAMGDKGKKDKEKGRKQKINRQEQKTKEKLAKQPRRTP